MPVTAPPADDWRSFAAVSMERAAVLLGTTRQHLHNMRGRGELRVATLGRRVLVPTSELRRLLGEVDQ